MPPAIAAVLCAMGVAGLLWLARERTRTSPALWLPFIWFAIVGSRNVGEWLESGPRLDAGSTYLEGNALDRNVLMVLIALGLVILARRYPRVRGLVVANVPVLLYFAFCGLSILWSDYPLVSLKRWFRSVGDLVMVLVILSDYDPVVALRQTLYRVGYVLLPTSILLIRYFPEWGRAYVSWSGAVMVTGVAAGKNGLGQTCLIYGLAAVWCMLVALDAESRAARNRRFAANGVIVAMACYLLWLADSKTSLACFLIAGCLMSMVSVFRFARRPAWFHPLIAGAVAAPIGVLFLGIGGGALEALGRDSSLTGRTDIWDIVTEFVANPMFGAGYESFWLGQRLADIARIHGVFFTQAHNGYLEIYLNLGWIGLILLGSIMVTGYGRLTSRIRTNPNSYAVRLAYFVVAVVYNFTEGAFKMMSSVWIAFLIANLASPLAAARRTRRPYEAHVWRAETGTQYVRTRS